MLIAKDYSFIFVHVPKTGGTSVSAVLEPYAIRPPKTFVSRMSSKVNLGASVEKTHIPVHAPIAWAQKRVPPDVFQRAYKFAFVRNPFDVAVSYYEFVKKSPTHSLHNRMQGKSFVHFLYTIRFSWTNKAQINMLTDSHGKIVVDDVFRFEDFKQDLRSAAAKCGVAGLAGAPRLNATSRTHYADYYGTRERMLVEKMWAKDFRAFGYAF